MVEAGGRRRLDRVTSTPPLPHLLDLAPEPSTRSSPGWGEPRYRARQVARWALRRAVTDFEAMTDLPGRYARASLPLHHRRAAGARRNARRRRRDHQGAARPRRRRGRRGRAHGLRPRGARAGRGRTTVCVSTQVGCAMGCVFCATGQQGFTRNLSPPRSSRRCCTSRASERVTNVVFMGMGEPLANYDATLAAMRWLTTAGLDLRARGITISTVGLRAGIAASPPRRLQVGLTISLHAPDDALRRALIPTAAGTTIDDSSTAAREYIAATGRRVTFAYALLEGVNDSEEQARAPRAARARPAGAREPDPLQPHGGRGPAPPLARARARVPARAPGAPASTPRCASSAARDRGRLRPATHRLRRPRREARAPRGARAQPFARGVLSPTDS